MPMPIKTAHQATQQPGYRPQANDTIAETGLN